MPLFFWFDIFLEARAEILEKNSLVFWSKRWQQKDILKLTNLYVFRFSIAQYVYQYTYLKFIVPHRYMYRFWFNSIMVQRNVLKQVEIIVLFTLLLILVIGETKSTNKTRKCLTKCEQCKRHYGYLFWAHLCTRTCFNHEGRIHINCQNFNSISQFLSGSYWYIRYFGGSYWKTSIKALF